MNIREEIVAKVQGLPEKVLPDVLDALKAIEEKKTTPGLLRRLQQIKIQGPPDFSRNFELYLNGEKKIEENLP